MPDSTPMSRSAHILPSFSSVFARLLLLGCIYCGASSTLFAQTVYDVSTGSGTGAGSLYDAIATINANPNTDYTINITGPITMDQQVLPIISNASITVVGGDNTLSGGGAYRPFFIESGDVTIQNLTIDNAQAQGGNGGAGGLGAGAAIFVDSSGHITLSNVSFTNNAAVGGNGSSNLGDGGGGLGGDGGFSSGNSGSGGGGGGLYGIGGNGALAGGGGGGGGALGNGGNASTAAGGGGGGGGGGMTANGANASGGDGGAGGGGEGGRGGDNSGAAQGQPGQAVGGGGGGTGSHFATTVNGNLFGGGGGGGFNSSGSNGGDFGGGGGGGYFGNSSGSPGGDGGFGGGGGNGGPNGNGGDGGFGGGGGLGQGNRGIAGFGGGDGTSTDGGGGAAFGGAVFVREGGSVTIVDGVSFSGNTVTAGTGDNDGSADGANLFLMRGVDTIFDISSGQTLTFTDPIGNNDGTMNSGVTIGKIGDGTLILSGDSSLAGTATLDAGTLSIGGTLGGDVQVNGGFLKGNGTIDGAVTNDGGTLAAGNSIGTAHYGSLNQNSGTIEVEIIGATNPTVPGTDNDLYDVTGAAVINGGTVSVVGGPGLYANGTTYTFLTGGGGISGTGFTGITDDLPFFNAVLDPFAATSASFHLERVAANFAGVATNCNQLAVGTALDVLTPVASGDLDVVIGQLQLSSSTQIQAAFDQMGGQIYATMATAQIQQVSQNLWMLRNQMALNSPCEAGEQGTGWIRGYGIGGEGQANGCGAFGYTHGVGGTEIAFQRCSGDGLALGAFGNFSWSRVALNGLDQHGSIQMNQFGGSIYHQGDSFYQLALLGGGFQEYDASRTIDAAAIGRSASSSFGGGQAFSYLEVGSQTDLGDYLLQPFGALQYMYLHQHGFTESGADAIDLNGRSIDANSFRGILGTSLQQSISLENGGVLTPRFRAAWMHEFADTRQAFAASFAGAPSGIGGFTVRGVDAGRDWFVAGVGFTLALGPQLSLFGGYDAMVNQELALHTGNGGLQLTW